MSGKSETVTKSRMDGLKLAIVAVIIGVGVYGNSYFSAEPLLYRVLGLLALSVIGFFIAINTLKGKALWDLIKQAKLEIRKVVWPSRQETVQTTLIVVAVVLIMGLLLWALDSLLGWIITSLIS